MTDIVQIPLTQGKVAIVDADDADRLLRFKWHAVRRGRVFYAVRAEPGKRGSCVYMHREIIAADLVDHRNRDGLDNRKINLRAGTQQNNIANAGMWSNNSSGFRGVTRACKSRSWKVELKVNQVRKHIGCFPCIFDAAEAYDHAAASAFGQFAFQNDANSSRELGHPLCSCFSCKRAAKANEDEVAA